MKSSVIKIEVRFSPLIPNGVMAIVWRKTDDHWEGESEARIYYPTIHSTYRLGYMSVADDRVKRYG